MAKTLVWQPDADLKPIKPKPKPADKPKPPEEKKKKQTKEKKKNRRPMSDRFWDTQIKSGKFVTFHFLDGREIQAQVLARDTFHLKVLVDEKIRLIFKHALKWVEEASSEDSDEEV